MSPFVLNKINFDTYKSSDLYTSCFMKIVPIRKIQLLHESPYFISNDIQQNNVTMTTLFRLCKWKKCNVWIIINYICYHIGDFPPTHVIENNKVLNWNPDLSYSNHYHIIHPMYALSHYKVNELREIAYKLHISVENKTKQQLYKNIQLIHDEYI
jgi:hypothetical protein